MANETSTPSASADDPSPSTEISTAESSGQAVDNVDVSGDSSLFSYCYSDSYLLGIM